MTEIKKKLVNQFVKPIMVGASLALITYLVSGSASDTIKLLGMDVNELLGVAAIGAVSSAVAEVAHNWVLPYISANQKLAQTESMVLAPLITAATAALLFDLSNPGLDLKMFFAYAAASEVAGLYAYESFVVPYLE